MYMELAQAALAAGSKTSGGSSSLSPVSYTTNTKTASDFDFSGFTVATGRATAAPRTSGIPDALETFADSMPGGVSPLVLLALVGLGLVAVTRLGK